eukprot:gene5430-6109_t
MLKQKKYDWKDSNLALFGSDTEKKVKKDSAESEPAWQGAGQEVGVQIWRIVKFKVTHWPKEDYGEFFDGDSYIILNTYKKEDSDELLYDVHFWIGKSSTQDEYGTAAYKTVELDTFLDDKPVQHREVMNHESKLFKSYFKQVTILKGGADTGFRRVVPEAPKTRLLHFKGTTLKNITIKEIPAKRGNLNSEDVFIIDKYYDVFQYNGKDADKDEKFKAAQYVQQLKSDRCGKVKTAVVLEEATTPSNHRAILSLREGASKKREAPQPGDRKLFKLSDASGSMEFEEIAAGKDINKSLFQSDDVFIFDRTDHCFVWVGKNASVDERRNAMSHGHNHLSQTNHAFVPISVVSEGRESVAFNQSF